MIGAVAMRALLAAAVVGAGTAAAHAGAWTQAKGHGQVIVSGTYTDSPKGFDDDGNAVDIPDYRKFELNTLIEYGITDAVTAILQPQIQSVDIGQPTDASRFGLGYSELGGRVRLWSDDVSVLSGQVVARIPGTYDDDDPASIGNTDPELDMRMLYGRSFGIGSWSSFLDVQLGYRARFGDPPSEFKADVTFGTRPADDLLLLVQSFNSIGDGSEKSFFVSGSEHKLQLSGVWDVNESWSLQLGGVATIAGENALRERGLVAAVWHRF